MTVIARSGPRGATIDVERVTATIDANGRLVVNGIDGDWKGRVVLAR